MTWENARKLIETKMQVGFKLTAMRKVLQAPPYSCARLNLDGTPGFEIKIGQDNSIDVPLSMLEQVFNAAIANDNRYDNDTFKRIYQHIAEVKGCYIHVIGGIFEHAGVAKKINRSTYRIA